MNRIPKAFENGKAFVAFVTAGDPSLDITEQLVHAMFEAGADLVELGIPFSDPVAEGPVIQAASERALKAGATTDKIFEMVARIRKTCDAPIVFMTYYNPIFRYGPERFAKACADAGVDGLIVPDLPFEEHEELAGPCDQYGISLIPLIAPTSHERIKDIARSAQGFVYCVSSLGVTGVRSSITTDLGEMVSLVKGEKDIPCAVGFGISTPAQVSAVCKHADGAIVGSAIVKIIAEHGEHSLQPVAEYVKSMKDAARTV